MKRIIPFLALAILCGATASFAQSNEDVIQLLRADIRTERNAMLTKVMNLSDQHSELFWPIQREYEAKATQIWDSRLALIKDYVANYETLTEDQAKKLAKSALDLEQKQLDLRKSTFNAIAKKLSPSVAGRWLQADGALSRMAELQTGLALPVMQTNDAATRP